MVNLITLDEYKLAKSITKADQDQILSQIIDSVSDIIQRYLDRKLVGDGVITEVFSFDYDTPYIYLDNYPIKPGSVVINPIESAYYDSTVHFPVVESTYVIDYNKGLIIRTGPEKSAFWPQGVNAVIVEYEMEADEESDIPPALKQAAIDLVTYYHKDQWRDSQQLMGSSINNQTGTGNTNTPSKSFPPHIQRVLDLFK
jgi:hypothetical protein